MPARRLLIVFGGRSSEHEISLRSAAEILKAIDHQRFTPVLLGIRRDGSWWTGPAEGSLEAVLEHGEPVSDLRKLAPDLVFPVLHGPYGEDGTLQGLLELAGVPYVGSGVLASAVGMDKEYMKRVFTSFGLPVGPYLVVRPRAWEADRAGSLARITDFAGDDLDLLWVKTRVRSSTGSGHEGDMPGTLFGATAATEAA